MKKYIEILQDAAAIEKKPEAYFFTDGVQDCAITIFHSGEFVIMLHDSDQVQISDIVDMNKECGNTSFIKILLPNKNLHAEKIKRHLNRLKVICNDIGFDYRKALKTNANHSDYSVFYDVENDIEVTTGENFESKIKPLPNKEKRKIIGKVNNYFLHPNAQNLPLDVQYKNSQHTEDSKLIHSIEYLIQTVEDQKTNPIWHKYNISILKEAFEAGILVFPKNFIEKYFI